MIRTLFVVLLAVVLVPTPAQAKVLNENFDNLPPGCDAVAGDARITVQGGREFAAPFPGAVFTFDQHVFEYPACTRVNVTFVNKDDIRHQFMVHGVWPEGMFNIEVSGPGNETGTFILPGVRSTVMFHCGVPQHQQKGMKGEFLVEGGVGDLPNILGVSGLPPSKTPAAQAADGAFWIALLGLALVAGMRRAKIR